MCSNGFHEVQYRKLRASNMLQYFQSIILSEDAGVNKPAKEYFDYALEKTGAKRESTLMIGDNFQTDILGAKYAGLDVMWFNPSPESKHATEPITYEVAALKDIMNIL